MTDEGKKKWEGKREKREGIEERLMKDGNETKWKRKRRKQEEEEREEIG